MFQSLDVFQTAAAMARHAGARQAVTAANVANADTPGYQARRLASFADIHAQAGGARLEARRVGHIGHSSAHASSSKTINAGSEPAPNGNAVSVEEEMLHSVNIMREHSRALAIYKHAMTVLRTTIGR